MEAEGDGAPSSRDGSDIAPRADGPGAPGNGSARDRGGPPAGAGVSPAPEPLGAEFYRQLVDTAPDALVVVDATGTIRLVNGHAERLFAWNRTELVGRPLELLVPDRASVTHAAHRRAFAADPRSRTMATSLQLAGRRSDGTEIPVDISLSALRTSEGTWTAASVRDASTRQIAEKELRRAYTTAAASMAEMEGRSRELALLSEMGDMLQSCLDTAEAYAVVAAFVAQLFPGTAGIVFRPTETRMVLQNSAQWGAANDAGTALSASDCWALRRGRLHRSTGAHRALRCRHDTAGPDRWSLCVPLMAHGDMVGLLHLHAAGTSPRTDGDGTTDEDLASVQRLAVNVAEHLSLALANLALREHLRAQSERDALTGLYNRRHLEHTVDEAVAEATRTGRPVGVLMLDVDDFKGVNDRHGHAAGDGLLRQLATLLLRETRGGDTVFRIGGDEFVVLLPGGTVPATTARAEQIRAAIDGQLGSTVSIGVAALPGSATTADELLHEADLCLYRAKALGRNQVVAAPPPNGTPAPNGTPSSAPPNGTPSSAPPNRRTSSGTGAGGHVRPDGPTPDPPPLRPAVAEIPTVAIGASTLGSATAGAATAGAATAGAARH